MGWARNATAPTAVGRAAERKTARAETILSSRGFMGGLFPSSPSRSMSGFSLAKGNPSP